MNGAAALFAQSRDLSAALAGTPPAAPTRVVTADPEAFKRGAVAMHQVTRVQQAMAAFAKQLEALPPDNVVRTHCEQLLAALADVLKQAETLPE